MLGAHETMLLGIEGLGSKTETNWIVLHWSSLKYNIEVSKNIFYHVDLWFKSSQIIDNLVNYVLTLG